MNPELTDEQVIEKLAKRGGWSPEVRKMYGGEKNVKGWGLNQDLSLGDKDRDFTTNIHYQFRALLTSLDSLRPILAGLTEDEWRRLKKILDSSNPAHCMSIVWQQVEKTIHYSLTLSPSTLARAIAEAIGSADSPAKNISTNQLDSNQAAR